MRVRQEDLLGSFKSAFNGFRSPEPKQLLGSTNAVLAEAKPSRTAIRIAEQDSLQRVLRPAYGKGPSERKRIGTHPDFEHLAGTDLVCSAPIVTLFMDIESSTRLGLWYEPAEVAQIKNAFICTAIELVHAFDGHVHRIQGDAVMAFFGGAKVKSEDAVVDALNAASTLWLFVKSTVIPMLKAEGYDEDFGIRVGIDYAPDAHWRSFGYPGVDEFSATAFQVDAAAKLQSAAGRNQIMLGQTLVEHLDIPDVITDTKTVFRDGDHQQEVYLLPNHTLPNGSRHNYRQVLLRAEEYLRCSPLAEAATSYTGDPNLQPIQLKMTVHQEEDGPALDEYASSSLVLPKGRHIRFAVSLPFRPRLPYTVTFEVENHGKQAHALAGDSYDNHTTVREIKSTRQHDNIVHWEHTAYRGLHYMTIVVKDCSKTLARRRVGVFIE